MGHAVLERRHDSLACFDDARIAELMNPLHIFHIDRKWGRKRLLLMAFSFFTLSFYQTTLEAATTVHPALDRETADLATADLPDTIEEVDGGGSASAVDRFKIILHKIQMISGTAFTALIVLMLILSDIDRRHPRKLNQRRPISVVVPCYNDADSVVDTTQSVFRTYPKHLVDLIVINDCSRDNSLDAIRGMQGKYPFRIIDNPSNKGKAQSLNDTIPLARHDLVLCLDADTLLNTPALSDMVARMDADPRIGAVSCPYRPRNKGFLPILQAVDYNMILLTQGAHNVFSAMALWGGCLMVRKQAFEEVGGFRLTAITEDVDLAFLMNRKHWRVEQSFRPVRSLVPQTVKAWVRQKLRWTSGGTQCYFRHIRVWIKNPIQIFFILSYSLLIASTIPVFFDGIDIVPSFQATWHSDIPFFQNLLNLNHATGLDILRRLGSIALCYIPSFIYIIPMIHRKIDIWKFALVIPFSILYFPSYIIVSLFGMAIGIRSLLKPKAADTKGWVN